MQAFLKNFDVTSGTVVGREHLRLLRNNQDSAAVSFGDDYLVAVVTDGCSSGRSSEVGARLGAAWLARWVPVHMAFIDDPQKLCAEVTEGLTAYLGEVARGMQPEDLALPQILHDFMLFTFIVAAIGEKYTWIFGLGDGVYSVNQKGHVLDSGPANAPDYLAYRLLGNPVSARLLYSCPSPQLDSLLIGTDGLSEIIEDENFERDARYGKNPSLLQKRLFVLSEQHKKLRDDTTAVVIQRKKVSP